MLPTSCRWRRTKGEVEEVATVIAACSMHNFVCLQHLCRLNCLLPNSEPIGYSALMHTLDGSGISLQHCALDEKQHLGASSALPFCLLLPSGIGIRWPNPF